MKLNRIATLTAGILVAGLTTFAQGGQVQVTPQQWTITATSESAPNAIPVPDSCSGQNPDNINDPNPNCYNPLWVLTDWQLTTNDGIGVSVSPVLANTFTNSNCSALGVGTISVTGFDFFGFYQATITMTVLDDNGFTNTLVFKGNPSSNGSQFSGSFSSSGPCMNHDSGTFTATLFPAVNGTYAGSFESPTGGPGSTVSMVFNTDANFNVTGSVKPAQGANLCFSNLTIGTALANTYQPSVATGDAIVATASDNTGNVVGFIASNTDANGRSLPNGGLFITYQGLAGACSGISGTDIPFRKVEAAHPPMHRPLRRFVFARP